MTQCNKKFSKENQANVPLKFRISILLNECRFTREVFPKKTSQVFQENILCKISFAISYVSHLFCAHLCAVPTNFNCNDENRIEGK